MNIRIAITICAACSDIIIIQAGHCSTFNNLLLLSWCGYSYIAFCRSLAILDYCNWVLKVRGTSSDSNLVGDQLWLGETTYGAMDSLAGPSMAAIDSPSEPSIATKFAVDGLAGPVVGGPSVA